MNNRIFTLLMIAFSVISCNKEPMTDSSLNEEISIVTSIATKATSTSFESGDKISLWAVEQDGVNHMPLQIGGNFINNECLTYNGTQWRSASTLYWSNRDCDFYALYPYKESLKSVDNEVCNLPLDQNVPATGSSLSGYEQADLLYASAKNVSRSAGSVTLTFNHILSRCSVNIIKGDTFEGEIPDDITVHIYNTATDYILDVNKGSVGKYIFGSRRTITMQKTDKQHFRAIVVPQNIELSTPLIEVTMGGIAYLLNYSLSFRPGYNHTLNLTLNTSPDQEKIEIGITPGFDTWN